MSDRRAERLVLLFQCMVAAETKAGEEKDALAEVVEGVISNRVDAASYEAFRIANQNTARALQAHITEKIDTFLRGIPEGNIIEVYDFAKSLADRELQPRIRDVLTGKYPNVRFR